MNLIQVMLAGMLTLAVVSTGYASPFIPDRGPVPFEVFDIDRNGYVSRYEYNRVHVLRIRDHAVRHRTQRIMNPAPYFSSIDADSDGRLSRDEIQAHQRERRKLRQQRHPDRLYGSDQDACPGKGNQHR